MRNLTKNTAHEAQAFGRLLQQFQDEGNFGLLVAKLAARYQGLEDMLWPLIEGRYLANATGETLTQIGKLVGEERPFGMADNPFRVRIYGRIAANVSHGTIPDLLNILGALQAQRPRIYQIGNAAIRVNFINGSSTLTCGCIRSILTPAKAPVTMDIVQHTQTPFGFLGNRYALPFGAGQLGASA